MCLRSGAGGYEAGVVIAYDSRKYSPEFALEAALVLARNGVKAYLFDALRPTPELSFAVRQLHALAGIVVTASHNPKAYNGYKLYWEDGGQVPPEHADQILARIKAREDWIGLEPMPLEAAKSSGLLEIIGEEIDQLYLAQVLELALHPELDREKGENCGLFIRLCTEPETSLSAGLWPNLVSVRSPLYPSRSSLTRNLQLSLTQIQKFRRRSNSPGNTEPKYKPIFSWRLIRMLIV